MVIKKQAFLVALMGLSLLTFSGCSSDKATDAGMKSDKAAMGAEESLDSKSIGVMEGRTSAGMVPLYFDFDKSNIRKDQAGRMQTNADFMKKNAKSAIRIEGNCDPRGTNEYNMALGERRALAAKKYLVNLGVSDANLSTISYGEERILVQGMDEASYAQNRRDDFVIVK
jgi:peptidoglycan-associated lipoprotein